MPNELLEVKFGVAGGGNIDGESGRIIRRDLELIAQQIKGDLSPKIEFSVNIERTKNNFEKQLTDLVKSSEFFKKGFDSLLFNKGGYAPLIKTA